MGEKHVLMYFEMDTKRLPQTEFSNRADKAWELYKERSPDLVVLADDNALKLLGPRFVGIKTPVVYLGINANPREYGVARATNVSGVLERPLLRRSILMLNKIMPIDKALLLMDSSETSRVIKEEIFYGNDEIKLGETHVDIKLVDNLDQWHELVLGAKKHGYDVLIAALYHTLSDGSGNHIDAEKIIQWTSRNTPIPPFGFWDFSIGNSANIGGYVVSGYEQGKAAGEMVERVLTEGERVRPYMLNRGEYVFSRSQLKKWDINLPDEIKNEVRFIE
ncbi:hypothetical protein P7F88_05350 [Vibrio hannami]|uniref:ABC transporter substrate-binding protein n=1 Tax=Vibrio hannami TaxID=2717094 RepID=UPI00240FF1A7|nr:hypothetical protein [Vibrio hannami]MDG3085559.1 hypothetical protein [Vibrio hannami]